MFNTRYANINGDIYDIWLLCLRTEGFLWKSIMVFIWVYVHDFFWLIFALHFRVGFISFLFIGFIRKKVFIGFIQKSTVNKWKISNHERLFVPFSKNSVIFHGKGWRVIDLWIHWISFGSEGSKISVSARGLLSMANSGRVRGLRFDHLSFHVFEKVVPLGFPHRGCKLMSPHPPWMQECCQLESCFEFSTLGQQKNPRSDRRSQEE